MRRALALVAMLSACGAPQGGGYGSNPTFYTSQGLPVYDEVGVSRGEVERLIERLIFELAFFDPDNDRVREYLRRGATALRFVDHTLTSDELLGLYVDGNDPIVYTRPEWCVAQSAAAHELAHWLRWEKYRDPDRWHRDERYFGPMGAIAMTNSIAICD